MLLRLGTALTLIGVIILVIFLITFSAGRADLLTLMAGAGLAIAGLALRRRGAPAVEQSSRFVTMRRVLRRDVHGPEQEEDV